MQRPLELDAAAPAWPADVEASRYDALFAANVCHIAPYAVSEGLLAGAARVLSADAAARLFIYGPFMVDGSMVESNRNFDAVLRGQNAEWGVRDTTDLAAVAARPRSPESICNLAIGRKFIMFLTRPDF